MLYVREAYNMVQSLCTKAIEPHHVRRLYVFPNCERRLRKAGLAWQATSSMTRWSTVVVYCFSISRNLSATRSFIRANANHFLPIPLMSIGHEGRAKASSRLTNNIGEIAVLRFRVFSFPEGRKYKGEAKPLQNWRGWGMLLVTWCQRTLFGVGTSLLTFAKI